MLGTSYSIIFSIPFVTASALHLAIQRPVATGQEHPQITPSPSTWDPTKTEIERRGIISDIAGDVGQILSQLGSNIPSYVASGVPNFFQDFPTGKKVQSSLGLDDSQVAALPTQVLNIPSVTPRTRLSKNLPLPEVTETGQIEAGTCAFMVMSISSPTLVNRNLMILQISS